MTVLALLIVAAQATDSPRAYMERLYASYRRADFSPFTHPERIFAPPLLAAIKEDSNLAHGEIGYLDGDPVCQCQDTAGMHPSIISVSRQGHDKATVRVSIRWDRDKPVPATFKLVRTSGGWRIADVSSTDDASLFNSLEAANRKARRR